MPIWLTKPVTEQPSLTLRDWGVMQMPEGGRHFVGYVIENREGRVSSPIVKFDAKGRRGVTLTGRVYELIGAPGLESDAEYVRKQWLALYNNPDWTDVTDEVWAEIQAVAGPPAKKKRARPLNT
jgi:hypothetical protein